MGSFLKWVNLGMTWLGFGMAVYSLTDEDKTNDPTANALAYQFMMAFKQTMDAAQVREFDDGWVSNVMPHFQAITEETIRKTISGQ